MTVRTLAAALRVVVRIDGANPKLPDYPLLPGDVLVARRWDGERHGPGTFNKVAPGLCVVGFELTGDQVAACEPAEDVGLVIQ